MKRNASLALIEQTIMLLVLVVAAALCLRAFVWSDNQSLYYTNRDQAITQLQNTAEILKAHHGDLSAATASYGGYADKSQWVLDFDENWNMTTESAAYRICVTLQTCDTDFLGCATLTALSITGESFAELCVSWQEVAP